MEKTIQNFPPEILEGIANIIGDTDNGLTGTEIHRLLLQANITDVSNNEQFLAKRKKLFNAFADFQNRYHCANNILSFVKLSLAPARFVSNPQRFSELLGKLNQQLAFVGYKLEENGDITTIDKACVISDVQIRANNLKQKVEERNGHREVFKYCTPELLQNNYFHAVFEANKGLFERIRELSGCTDDGNKLIERVFSSTPILIINNYISQSERDEHSGFCSMFRNTSAHESKINWNIDEQDALDILGIISYCHRRLDKAQKIRLA